jgi:hypothetical protein
MVDCYMKLSACGQCHEIGFHGENVQGVLPQYAHWTKGLLMLTLVSGPIVVMLVLECIALV